VIDLVGLNGREQSYPHQLSGGQQQRVGIARSLAVKPDIWFLDEPFSALDPLIRTQMQGEFLSIQRNLHKTIVFVTHDILKALRLADRTCIMKDGEVVQIGTPSDIVLHPADAYVRKFTADVPLAQILRVDAVMNRAAAPHPGDRTVLNTATLGVAIKLFDDTVEALNVVDDNAVVLGTLNALQIIRGPDQMPDTTDEIRSA
jgi:glycine betaine/proline transport system ATP-binding protein